MEIYTTAPSPENQGWKNSAFWLLRGFILDLGGWGFAIPFYSVQDKSLSQSLLSRHATLLSSSWERALRDETKTAARDAMYYQARNFPANVPKVSKYLSRNN